MAGWVSWTLAVSMRGSASVCFGRLWWWLSHHTVYSGPSLDGTWRSSADFADGGRPCSQTGTARLMGDGWSVKRVLLLLREHHSHPLHAPLTLIATL